eukprot:c14544_g1_i1.p1 GENE.c14544_g1_i1~~c14544_g1_i1.p1  ORF type:complete len:232 (-),score=79.05 c14544_g1_i1:15-632(-)
MVPVSITTPLIVSPKEVPLFYEVARKLVLKIRGHKESIPFHEPEDTSIATDYLSIVSKPLDLLTIYRKLQNLEYENYQDFRNDVRKMFENTVLYYQHGKFFKDEYKIMVTNCKQLILIFHEEEHRLSKMIKYQNIFVDTKIKKIVNKQNVQKQIKEIEKATLEQEKIEKEKINNYDPVSARVQATLIEAQRRFLLQLEERLKEAK